jgi:hypothetical protein
MAGTRTDTRSGGAQVAALVLYIASSFPMGVQGMRIIAQIVYTALRPFIMVRLDC